MSSNDVTIVAPEIIGDVNKFERITRTRIDPSTNAMDVTTINRAHSNVHLGRLYSQCLYTEALVDEGSIDYLLQIPEGKQLHSAPLGACGGDALIFLFEGTTFSDAGVIETVANHNRTSSNISTAISSSGPTITDVGTEISCGLIPGGTGGNAVGGQGGGPVREGAEWLLAPNTDYLIRLTNISGITRAASITLVYYEVDAP